MDAVTSSEKLRRHVNFLYERGSAYLVHNDTVLFHACVPMAQTESNTPKHAAPKQVGNLPKTSTKDPKDGKGPEGKRHLWLIPVVIVALLAGVYLAGVAVFGMDTPYSTSACSIVRLWWDMTMSCVDSLSCSMASSSLERFASSSAASTSSNT